MGAVFSKLQALSLKDWNFNSLLRKTVTLFYKWSPKRTLCVFVQHKVTKSCRILCNPMNCSTASLSFTISLSLLKLMSIEPVMPSNHLILCPLLSPSPPTFSLSQHQGLFQRVCTSSGQSIRASASVLPMNTQGWFPLGLTGLISLLSKGLSRVFSSTTVWKH